MGVEFRILGPVEVLADGQALALGGRRERAVLARLLLSANRVVTSEQLVDELWPDHAPKDGLHSLRVAISRLRKGLGALGAADVLVTQSPGYLLRVDDETFDLARFERLVVQGRQEMDRKEYRRAADSLREALEQWRGPALAQVADASFVRAESVRLEEGRLAALEARIEADLSCGRHTELTAELEALTRAHPLREALWGQRMLALYRCGRQAEALRAFQELRRVLGEELGIEPSMPLAELERAILRQEPGLTCKAAEPTTVQGAPSGGVSFSDRTPFVGREAERAELHDLLDRAAAGTGGLVLIGGEPGVGKSRLVEELAGEAGGRFRVLVGHCYESGRDLSYMPWVELIETAMADTEPGELRRSLGDEAPEFARLVPELRRLLPDIPAPVELPPEQQRRYTFNSIREYLTRASRNEPRLLVLEDLHWADESTLLLLEHLAERLATIPCLVIGTHRDSPTDVTPLLAETLSNLVRRRQARRLNLSRHSERDVAALLEALSHQTPPEKVRTAIYAETDGNAFFVEEVFRHLAESGRLLDEEGRFRDDLSIADLDVPANVRLVIGRRLDRLDETTARALSIAAVAGRHLGFELWEAIADVEGDELIDAVEGAERTGLIVTEGTGDQEEYWFAHELIRQTVLTRIPAARRRRYHLRVADAMERLHGDNLPGHAATIAAQLVDAGSAADPARLFRFLVLAGSRSLGSAAFEDGLQHLHRAASLAEHVTPGERAEMQFHLGVAERATGNTDEAIAAWRRSIEIYEAEGDTEAISRIGPLVAWNLVFGGRFKDSHELAERGLAALGEEPSSGRGRLLAIAGAGVAADGQYQAGVRCTAEAAQIGDRLGDATVGAYAALWKGAIHHLYMESREAMDSFLRAGDVLRAAGDPWQLTVGLGFTAFSSPGAGEFSAARRAAAEGRPLAERVGNLAAAMQCGRGVAMADWSETGDLDALEAFAHRDMRVCLEAGLPWVSWSWCWLAVATFLRGDWETAADHAEQGDGLSPPGVLNGVEWSLHFEYRAYAGQRDRALAMFEARRAELPRLGEPNGWGSWAVLMGAVEGLVVLGERDQAAELYPLVGWCIERTANVIHMQPDCPLVERLAGIAATAGANWDAAERHFATALEQAETLPNRAEQAHTRRWYADMLLRRGRSGDRDAALGLLADAGSRYQAMGMPRHHSMTRASGLGDLCR